MQIDGNTNRSGATPPPPQTAQQTARTLLDQHRTPGGHDAAALAGSLRDLRLPANDNAAAVRAIEAQLTPVERGQFHASMEAAQPSVNGQPFAIGDPSAPPIASWGQQAAGTPYRQAWDNVAATLNSRDPAAVQAEIERQLYGTAAPSAAPASAPSTGPDPVQLGLDLGQMALDLTGIVDPSPISDGANAIVSLGRSIG